MIFGWYFLHVTAISLAYLFFVHLKTDTRVIWVVQNNADIYAGNDKLINGRIDFFIKTQASGVR